jgi:tetratricopeptide (TPR) repeat protein
VANKKKRKKGPLSQLPKKRPPAAPAVPPPPEAGVESYHALPDEPLIEGEPSLESLKKLILANRREDAMSMLAALPENKAEEVPQLEELGHMLMARQDFDGASVIYRRWLVAEPTSAKAYNSLGASLVSAGWTDAALPALQMAVSHDPDNSIYHLNLAKLYMVSGHWEEARAILVNIAHRFPEQQGKLDELWKQFPDDVEKL